jgi:hypothetical protein
VKSILSKTESNFSTRFWSPTKMISCNIFWF